MCFHYSLRKLSSLHSLFLKVRVAFDNNDRATDVDSLVFIRLVYRMVKVVLAKIFFHRLVSLI